MSNLKDWFEEHFWITEEPREDQLRDILVRSGVSLPSLNERLDEYMPESAGRFPKLLEQDSYLLDVLRSSTNRFKRQNTQRPWSREERRDRLTVYLAATVADYISNQPETFTRVIQANMPPLPEQSYAQ